MNYEIIMKIELKESNKSEISAITKESDGSYHLVINGDEAMNLDKCEKALLDMNYQVLRSFLVEHFSQLSEAKAREYGQEEEVFVNATKYKVEGEIGRFKFTSHTVKRDDKQVYNTAKDFFPALHAREWYKTQGFKELALVHKTTEKSYRKVGDMLNRVHHQQEGGVSSRCLREYTELEGIKLSNAIDKKCQEILAENGFDEKELSEGPKKGKKEYKVQKPSVLPEDEVQKALELCQEELKQELKGDYCLSNNSVIYENPQQTVNITSDDVCVKKQKRARKLEFEGDSKKRKSVYNSIIHVEKDKHNYVLNGSSIVHVIKLLIAFLINSDLLKFRLQFFTDGLTTLQDTILNSFLWYKNISIILDWYHLEKKCKERLSSAMKNRHLRNDVLEKVTKFLWYGLIDDAVEFLSAIDPLHIKNQEAIDKLINYLVRNYYYIPCYAIRKKLGLRNSSGIGEKMNDLVVSDRQKHNGMSWSRLGSIALASLTANIRNNEHHQWFEHGTIEFKLPLAS